MSAVPLPDPELTLTRADVGRVRDVMAHPVYRPDIDGLRALAVCAVLAFHAFPAKATGGFIGVDVFFVISGYLISTIIFGSLARDAFSFVTFYVRRIRRIFPALLLVLAATLAFGWFTLLADEYGPLGKHVAAGAAFVSNLVFWQESGYFDSAAYTKPLLHLWSLGIEEQFYIVWPVLLWVLWRVRSRLLTLTVAAALASFAFNVLLMHNDPVADFYSPFSRLWELAIGSLLAYVTLSGWNSSGMLTPARRDVLSLAGAALLATGFFAIDSSSVFPGLWALLPTLGAAAIIAAGSEAWFNCRVLSQRLLVWIGLISFPLYLWHWPILSFIHILAAERPTRTVRIAALALSVILAWLTYRLVERPLRETRRSVVLPLSLAVAMLIAGIAGYLSFATGGAPGRAAAQLPVVTAGELGQDAFFAFVNEHSITCADAKIRAEAESWNGTARCRQTRRGPVDLAVVGDSHAEHLFIGLTKTLPARNIAYYVQSSLPVMRNSRFDAIFERVIDDPAIHDVVLAAWWSLRFSEAGFGRNSTTELQDTVAALTKAGKRVYLMDDTPNFSFSARLCKYEGGLFREHKCSENAKFSHLQRASYHDALELIQTKNPQVTISRLSPYFCSDIACSMELDRQLLFRDSDHLSVPGSLYVGARFVADHPELHDSSANTSRANH